MLGLMILKPEPVLIQKRPVCDGSGLRIGLVRRTGSDRWRGTQRGRRETGKAAGKGAAR